MIAIRLIEVHKINTISPKQITFVYFLTSITVAVWPNIMPNNFNIIHTNFKAFVIICYLFQDNGYRAGWGNPYLTSKQMCLERFQLLLSPDTYCKTKEHTLEGIRSWTNVFRSETEAKLTKG